MKKISPGQSETPGLTNGRPGLNKWEDGGKESEQRGVRREKE